MPSQEQEQNRKFKSKQPINELDMQMALTEPAWGKDEINPELAASLTKEYFQFDKDGNLLKDNNDRPILSRKALWSTLGFMTRDLRLSNLSPGDLWKGLPNEIEYCEYWLNLANDFLIEGYDEPFQLSLERVAAKLELNQSKKGFLRNKMNTYREEISQETIEPPKRKVFGGNNGM